jgi:hypothetical protein
MAWLAWWDWDLELTPHVLKPLAPTARSGHGPEHEVRVGVGREVGRKH